MQKNGKFQGGHGKFDLKSRGVNFKKIDINDRNALEKEFYFIIFFLNRERGVQSFLEKLNLGYSSCFVQQIRCDEV